MLNKLQLNSLVTSLLLLPTLALTAHPANVNFDNLTNYHPYEFSLSTNHLENWK
jgi:hypothetical protein